MRKKLRELFDLVFGFRKFIAFMLLLALAIVFRSIGYINGSELVDLMKNVGVAFMATNSFEHVTSVAKDYIASKSPQKQVSDEPPEDEDKNG